MKALFQTWKIHLQTVLLLAGCTVFQPGRAQTAAQDSIHRVQDGREIDRSQWTGNPAAAVAWPQHGYAGVSADYTSGDFRRPMQAAQRRSLGLHTGGLRRLGGWTVAGLFRYGRRYDSDVAWSGVYDPYEGNPFLWADSNRGDWERDEVQARITLQAPSLGRITTGLSIAYGIGAGARRNEPKPFFRYRDIALRPGLVYSLSRNKEIGLAGEVGLGKEENELGFFSRDNVVLYRLRGFGTYTKTPFVTGERRREEIRWKASAYYSYDWDRSGLLFTGFAEQREDEVIEGLASPQPTGYFTGISWGGEILLRSGGAGKGGSASLKGRVQDGYADDVIFRAESASWSRQEVSSQLRYWKEGRKRSWLMIVSPAFTYFNQTDLGTQTLWDVSQLSLTAEWRYRRQLSAAWHFFLAPAAGYAWPVDTYFTSRSQNIVLRELTVPDYRFFATAYGTADLRAGLEIQSSPLASVHFISLESHNRLASNHFNRRNELALHYTIFF